MDTTAYAEVTVRAGGSADTDLVLRFIRELADFEGLLQQVEATRADLEEWLFGDRHIAEVLIAELGKAPVGFALFFHNFSTFIGRPGLYVEDVYVRPEYRGRGIGFRLFVELAKLARERRCGRMEWAVLNWNTSAIDFYRRLGAVPQEDWKVQRLDESAISRLAAWPRLAED